MFSKKNHFVQIKGWSQPHLTTQDLPEISWFAKTHTNYVTVPKIFCSKKVFKETQSDAENFIGWNFPSLHRKIVGKQPNWIAIRIYIADVLTKEILSSQESFRTGLYVPYATFRSLLLLGEEHTTPS